MVVLIAGIRVGLVRRLKFSDSCEDAVAKVFQDLPEGEGKRLLVVDAGIATKRQFADSTDKDALLGRLRSNCKLRYAPPPCPLKPGAGRPPIHGPELRPGSDTPEVEPDQQVSIRVSNGILRVRRWNQLHFEEHAETLLDVVHINHPDYDRPLLIGTVARELTTGQMWASYSHRSPLWKRTSSSGKILL